MNLRGTEGAARPLGATSAVNAFAPTYAPDMLPGGLIESTPAPKAGRLAETAPVRVIRVHMDLIRTEGTSTSVAGGSAVGAVIGHSD